MSIIYLIELVEFMFSIFGIIRDNAKGSVTKLDNLLKTLENH